MTLPLQSNLLGMPLAPAQCVVDPDLSALVQHIIRSSHDTDASVVPHFLDRYQRWIRASVLNNLQGLDEFGFADYAQGTTEVFDKFYLRHANRRMRFFRGEYLYHKICLQNSGMSWCFLDDQVLEVNDAVMVSMPFADTGDVHLGLTKDFLDTCEQLDIPVLIDCAFFGICGGIQFDFSHRAIQQVTFSLSKAFPVSTLRIGMRLSRREHSDGLAALNQSGYVNALSAKVGLELLDANGPDSVFHRYRDKQVAWCHQHGLRASSTVIFGIDHDHRFDRYNRGSQTNRICFSTVFHHAEWPQDCVI